MNSGNSRPEVFLEKCVLKIWSKFAGEHLCRSAVSVRSRSNCIEITLRDVCSPVNLLHIFRTPFLKNISGWLLLELWQKKSDHLHRSTERNYVTWYQENCPLWKLPPVKITPQNFFPEKIPPWENYLQSNPLPTYRSYKWKKKQNNKIFCLEESCAIQHLYQNNQCPLWYTDNFTENAGLRYFLYRVKKIQKSN